MKALARNGSARGLVGALVACAVALTPPAVRAQEAPGGERPSDLRAVGLTTAAVALGAGGLFAMGYGLFMLLEPSGCAQPGPMAGECLRTATPSEGYRLNGAALLGVGVASAATAVALAFLADEAWRALAPAEARAAIAAWLAADARSAIAGVTLRW